MATTGPPIAATPTRLHLTGTGLVKRQSFTESTPMSAVPTHVRDYSAGQGRERISTAGRRRQSTHT